MFSSNFNAIVTIAGFITAVGGALLTIAKIVKDLKRHRKSENERILSEAKEHDQQLKEKLEAKINLLEVELRNLEHNVSKDLSNLKDNHTIELKNLSTRIESLREDLNSHHSQILQLLMKLVD
jgi:cell division septum initiation protein DivIVA